MKKKIKKIYYTLQDINYKIKNCKKCKLFKTRKNVVCGKGNKNPKLLLIGEAPGYYEDLKGMPFIGKSGKLLYNILLALNINYKNIYITNILKCRPINIFNKNRKPMLEEIKFCIQYLFNEINLLKPKIIITLGKIAALSLLKFKFLTLNKIFLSQLRNKIYYYNNIPVIITYHPSYILRNLKDKYKIWKDFCLIKKIKI